MHPICPKGISPFRASEDEPVGWALLLLFFSSPPAIFWPPLSLRVLKRTKGKKLYYIDSSHTLWTAPVWGENKEVPVCPPFGTEWFHQPQWGGGGGRRVRPHKKKKSPCSVWGLFLAASPPSSVERRKCGGRGSKNMRSNRCPGELSVGDVCTVSGCVGRKRRFSPVTRRHLVLQNRILRLPPLLGIPGRGKRRRQECLPRSSPPFPFWRNWGSWGTRRDGQGSWLGWQKMLRKQRMEGSTSCILAVW